VSPQPIRSGCEATSVIRPWRKGAISTPRGSKRAARNAGQRRGCGRVPSISTHFDTAHHFFAVEPSSATSRYRTFHRLLHSIHTRFHSVILHSIPLSPHYFIDFIDFHHRALRALSGSFQGDSHCLDLDSPRSSLRLTSNSPQLSSPKTNKQTGSTSSQCELDTQELDERVCINMITGIRLNPSAEMWRGHGIHAVVWFCNMSTLSSVRE